MEAGKCGTCMVGKQNTNKAERGGLEQIKSLGFTHSSHQLFQFGEISLIRVKLQGDIYMHISHIIAKKPSCVYRSPEGGK